MREKFGEMLRKARKEKKLSAKKLCVRLKKEAGYRLDFSSIYGIEKGKLALSYILALYLAHILGQNKKDFLESVFMDKKLHFETEEQLHQIDALHNFRYLDCEEQS